MFTNQFLGTKLPKMSEKHILTPLFLPVIFTEVIEIITRWFAASKISKLEADFIVRQASSF